MAKRFESLTIYPPPLVVLDDGNPIDPLMVLDDIIKEGTNVPGKKAELKQKLKDARKKINWLPKELTDIVDQYRRSDADVDQHGRIDKERLTLMAGKLMDKVKELKIGFANY